MEEKNASLRHRIPTEKRKECLKLFEERGAMPRGTTPGRRGEAAQLSPSEDADRSEDIIHLVSSSSG